MRLFTFLLLLFSLNCFSQSRKNNINADTIIINTTLADTTVFKLDTLKSEKSLSAWFSFINDSGGKLSINSIYTGDGGTYSLCNGSRCLPQILEPNDTLTFCIFFETPWKRKVQSREIKIVGIDNKDDLLKPLIMFKLLLVTKQ